jgi:hypothetical protein
VTRQFTGWMFIWHQECRQSSHTGTECSEFSYMAYQSSTSINSNGHNQQKFHHGNLQMKWCLNNNILTKSMFNILTWGSKPMNAGRNPTWPPLAQSSRVESSPKQQQHHHGKSVYLMVATRPLYINQADPNRILQTWSCVPIGAYPPIRRANSKPISGLPGGSGTNPGDPAKGKQRFWLGKKRLLRSGSGLKLSSSWVFSTA